MVGRQFRPLGLGDIFDEGFDLYKRNLPLLALVYVVATVPFDIIAAIVQANYLNYTSDFAGLSSSDNSVVFSAAGALFGKNGITLFVSAFIYAIPICALAVAASRLYLGDRVTLRQSYQIPLARLPSLIWTVLLYAVAMAIGFAFCGIGCIWPGIAFIFIAQTFAVEHTAGFGALKRSAQLISGYGGRVFGAVCLLAIIYLIMVIGVSVPLGYAFDSLLRITPGGHSLFVVGDIRHADLIRERIVNQASSGIADLLVAPFIVSVITVLYFDLRVRKEAFDIEMLARDLNYAPLSTFGYQAPAVNLTAPAPKPARGAK